MFLSKWVIGICNLPGCAWKPTLQEINISHQTGKGTSSSSMPLKGGYVNSLAGTLPSWWFQPLWKILHSQNGNLPLAGMKIKNIWNHHPVTASHPQLAKCLPSCRRARPGIGFIFQLVCHIRILGIRKAMDVGFETRGEIHPYLNIYIYINMYIYIPEDPCMVYLPTWMVDFYWKCK